MSRNNQVIAIVGAGSGIGAAAAKKWASEGASVALFDSNRDTLAQTVKEIQSTGAKVLDVEGDIKNPLDLALFQERVYKHHPDGVDLLFLNAGASQSTGFADPTGIGLLMATNFLGLVNGVSAFLGHLKKQKKPAHVVLTGSKQGITNPPGNPGYNASKAAVKSYAEGLSYSFDSDPATAHLKAHLLVPGWTHTPLTSGGKTDAPKPAGAWTPEQVVGELEKGIAAKEFYILAPDNEVTVALDKKRIQWSADDIIKGRPALSRWRPEYKDESAKFLQ